MPGTVPKSFDPSLVQSTNSSDQAQAPKAAVVSSSDDDLHLLTASAQPQPLSHPSSGVASLGASTAIANASHTAALSNGNPGAKMTSKSAAPPLPPKDDEKEVALRKFVETSGHFSLVRNFRLADAFTIMNAFCAAQSFFCSGRYLITGNTRYAWLALWCPFFGAIFDLLDGKIARWRGGGSMLGQELDSLADSISFGAAPCVAAFTLGLRTPLDTLILTIFICAGVARLARFNVTTALIPHDKSGKAKYFEGLPIPTSLILVGGMALCLLFGKFEGADVVKMEGGALQFTNRFVSGSTSGVVRKLSEYSYGVPFGKTELGLKQVAGLLGLKLSGGLVDSLTAELHWISLLWLAWAVAMVSKTLRVPKP
ncbi:CDP-diacylglycerol--serine O-phosphatidyltransferase [Jaminaea rosea]|uniref:CDP-diacylglycerol--serine O-phosphatidyltransferase n=1 Tax=Jaminaea rosea TaxID=1569628 RepID=A0A316ULE8_9BASI|nr:CDP-diacylglycerol--serine O-phosphatidyltransferase [Jaminaea rosea]PWN25764.1 CDP-diacylglycerol--serine O-phosphatidyltransferase [Jaminaea rosea]